LFVIDAHLPVCVWTILCDTSLYCSRTFPFTHTCTCTQTNSRFSRRHQLCAYHMCVSKKSDQKHNIVCFSMTAPSVWRTSRCLHKSHGQEASSCQTDQTPHILVQLRQGWRHPGVDGSNLLVRSQASKSEAHWPDPRNSGFPAFNLPDTEAFHAVCVIMYSLMCVLRRLVSTSAENWKMASFLIKRLKVPLNNAANFCDSRTVWVVITRYLDALVCYLWFLIYSANTTLKKIVK